MPAPLADLLTWTTYGTWLPGDERGWVEPGKGILSPDSKRSELAQAIMIESACLLTMSQREIVERTIADHCAIRGWQLHAVNCRTNHVHAVVTADVAPKEALNQLKAYCTRRLKEHLYAHGYDVRRKWWSEGGSKRYLNTVQALDSAIHYVLHGQ